MKKQNKLPKSVFKTISIFFLSFLLTHSLSAIAYQDEYAALLSRMAEKGIKSPSDGDFLGAVAYWQELWDRSSSTDTWKQMMSHAVLYKQAVTEYDGTTGYTYALLTLSDNVAWLAFPGVSTDTNLESGEKGPFIAWPEGSANSNKDVHQYFYAEWKALKNQVTQWLANNSGKFDKLIVTGHSKGAVLSQYFLADHADQLSGKSIHFTAFGSPNAGNEAFIKYWAGRSALKRAKFYTTHGTYKPSPTLLNPFPKSSTQDDIITWEEAPAFSMEVMTVTLSAGRTLYPRGLSRKVDTYLTDYASNLERQILQVSSADAMSEEQFALTIHDDSY